MNLCSYGCGRQAQFYFKNGKSCCSYITSCCPSVRKINSERKKGYHHTEETRRKISKTRKIKKIQCCFSEESKKRISEKYKGENNPMFGKHHTGISKNRISKGIRAQRGLIEKIKETYLCFIKEEDIRYEPTRYKPVANRIIQVHCKNHNCSNSKEKGGWFTPTLQQLYSRIDALEKEDGNDGAYFYCSKECKNSCPLYRLRGDPYSKNEKQYTDEEYQTFRTFVLERDNYICQFCGEKALDVHHEKPQKLEPFFSLDPDYAWSCCEQCHYKHGHKDECTTGNLATKIC